MRFTVVIGNPPYAKSQTENGWILDLMRPYREGLAERKSDTHREEWKFVRCAAYYVTTASAGIAAYVVNNSFLDAPTLRQMRQHLLEQFGTLAVVNLHGDSNKREVAPDGSADGNVFEIKQGVCVAVFRRPPRVPDDQSPTLRYGDVWGTQDHKYKVLCSNVITQSCDRSITPDERWRSFLPRNRSVDEEYCAGVSIAEIWRPVCGIETKRDDFVIDIERACLERRIEDFAGSSLSEVDVKARFGVQDNDWVVMDAKRRLGRDESWRDAIVQCVQRPFDFRWILYLDYVLARDRGLLMAGMRRPKDSCRNNCWKSVTRPM